MAGTKLIIEAKHPVRYRFVCEKCGRDSGWQTHTFYRSHILARRAGEAAPTSQEQEACRQATEAELQRAIDGARTDAAGGKYIFSDRCPYCGKGQRWGLRGLGAMLLAIPVLLFCGMWWATKNLTLSAAIGAVLTVALLVWFLSKKSGVILQKSKRKPTIDWNGR